MSKIPSMGVTYEKNSPVKLIAGVDEANNVRGGISVIFGSQVSFCVTTARDMKYTS